MIRLYYGGTVIQDYGVLSEERIWFGTQSIRLLRCQKGNDIFYVLETEQKNLASFQVNFSKINLIAGEKMVEILRKKNDITIPTTV